MSRRIMFFSFCVTVAGFAWVVRAEPATLQLPAERLDDKIRGGLMGQILGNLNGLPHEFKYIDEPGNVTGYTPSLPEGARTDDDTDVEWVYLKEMADSRQLFLPYDRVRGLWRRHINRSVWCANLYARQLMELGIEPPMTGRLALNPWSNFNLSGSFLAESFALVCPAMPRTASRLALHYTHVGIDAEPAQTTQFVAAMIATAFIEEDVDRILDAGLAAVDPKSVIPPIARNVRQWVAENPDDWRKTRRLIRDAYTRYGGDAMADRNGYELNTAATIASLLYGRGDFAATLTHAFNFGWDCDNNAATGGTIIGVMRGKAWFDRQGWTIKDVYRNTSRDAMPDDETITRFGDRIVEAARLAITGDGGTAPGGREGTYVIAVQSPANVEPLPEASQRLAELKQAFQPSIERDLLEGPAGARARAAYLAIYLGDAAALAEKHPEAWRSAVAELQKHPITKEIFSAPKPAGPEFCQKAEGAGLVKPGK